MNINTKTKFIQQTKQQLVLQSLGGQGRLLSNVLLCPDNWIPVLYCHLIYASGHLIRSNGLHYHSYIIIISHYIHLRGVPCPHPAGDVTPALLALYSISMQSTCLRAHTHTQNTTTRTKHP